MITLLTGENSYEITRALERLMAEFPGQAERIDGAELEERQLPDLLAGATLFADKRLVIIKDLSDNKPVWTRLGDWLGRVDDSVAIVLVDEKPDKRTKTYKDLKAVATIHEFTAWSDRDVGKAEAWTAAYAKEFGISLDREAVRALVYRVGNDQWQLHHALMKLSVLETVTPAIIEEVVESNPAENVFHLFDAALRGESKKITEMLRVLEQTDDPYMVFGLLCSQAFQLATLTVADKPDGEVAKAIGVHPFALQKLVPHARRLGRAGAKQVIESFAAADDRLKSGAAEPWTLIDQALIKIAALQK